jgi:glycosyltransferase involved in cell wall biosynthesis
MHFTIVIPTRERPSTLVHAIQTCISQDYDDLEILVSDNASVDNTREIVSSFSDRRLRYVNTGRRLSMTASFEFAFSRVKPGYLIAIGDDDGIPVGAIRAAAQIVKETKAVAITTERAQYDWPGMAANRANQILFGLRSDWERRQICDFYPRVLNRGLSYYQVPLFYHCYVATDLVDAVRCRLGTLFHSTQVDIYSAMLLGGFVSDYVHSFAPLVVNGASPKSNGAQHFGQVKDASEVVKWQAETDIPMRKHFQIVKSIRYLILESFLQARDHLPELASFKPDLRAIFLNALAELEHGGAKGDKEIVRDTALAMGVLLPSGRAAVGGRKWQMKLERYWNRAIRLRDTAIIDCNKYGVSDVMGAVRLMDQFKQGVIKNETTFLAQMRLALRRR